MKMKCIKYWQVDERVFLYKYDDGSYIVRRDGMTDAGLTAVVNACANIQTDAPVNMRFITNFGRDEMHVYAEALRRSGVDGTISTVAYSGPVNAYGNTFPAQRLRTHCALYVSNADWEKKGCLAEFWRIFWDVRAEMKMGR